MPQRQRLAYLILLIAVVVMPTAMSLAWYAISRDPNLRPLGITKQALYAYNGGGDGVEIVAVVDWPASDTGERSRAQLTRALTESFAAKGVEIRIEFRAGQAAGQVTYIIGKSVLGPYPTTRAAEGISAAVEAFRMY
ncbi:hypothetical protein [Sinisalibacter aestuarii]|uniref:Uncharacterized protein n=1 Tax=Sinisalibacter aestuarii TaxID=2949426 RepID=A0ABQ5LRB1_9RHOB|nr:hypothetical protein [Sinisalibacter aestuarii]GKY86617.1 hypothetical protein STA1M1_04860 [Sinisalibacter aestuarii]